MNCRECENLISGYMDGELEPAQKKEFEEHFRNCPGCRALLDEFSALEDFLEESEPPLPDEAYWAGFDARLNDKLENEKTAKKPWYSFVKLFKKPVSWAAVAILILLLVVTPSLRSVMAPTPSQQAPDAKPAVHTREFAKEDISDKMMEEEMSFSDESSEEKFYPGESRDIAVEMRTPRALEAEMGEAAPSAPSMPAPASPEEDGLVYEARELDDELGASAGAEMEKPKGGDAEGNALYKKERVDIEDIPVMDPEQPGAVTLAYSNRPPGADDYIATSEAVLLRVINMDPDPGRFELLRESLKSAGFPENLKQNRAQFKGSPDFEKHNRAMTVIIDRFINIDPDQLPELQEKIIESGILEKTRELR